MTIDLSGKRALVTGGGIGIGSATAIALARAGADVAVTFYSHAGEETVSRLRALGRNAFATRMDACDPRDVERTATEVGRFFDGHIDILVNNAGGLLRRVAVTEMCDNHWRNVLDVNLSSAFYCVRSILSYMNNGWGRIINVSSLAAHTGGGPGATAYAAAKAGLDGLTRGLAKELAPRGITVNAVAPGLILHTPFHERFTPREAQEATIAATPLGRAGMPDDVAGMILYLASDLASFVTGCVFHVNGGTRFA